MKDTYKTKKQLIEGMEALRQEVVELKKGETERKRMEEALRDSMERYRTLVENINLGITLIGSDYRIIMTNAAHGRLFKKPALEFIGKECFKEFEKRSAVCIHCPGTRAMATGRPVEVETEGIRDDGSRFAARIYAYPNFDLDGNVTGFIEVVEDITERERAKEELRLHSEIMQNMAEGVYLTMAENGIIVYTNPKFEKMFGYGPGEMIGKHVSIVNAPTAKSPEETAKEIMCILDKTGTWQGEVKNVKKDGTPFWCYATVSVFNHPEHGKVWISVHTDITERKLAEEALRESEERYRLLFNNVSDAVFVHEVSPDASDPGRFKFIEVNDRACQYLGYSREELLQMSVLQIDAPETLSNVPAILKKLFAEGRATWEGIHMSKDGHRIPVEISIQLFELYGKPMILSAVRDITERKRFEESLKQLMHKHQLILDAAGEGIVGLDLEGKITFANPFAVKTTGYSVDELIGQNLHKLVHYKKPDGTPYPYEECPSYETLKNGVSKNIRDEIFFRKDGTSFPVRYTSTPIIEEGVIKGAVVTFRDITERKRLEEQYLQAQKMEAVGHLAGGVAHDFNNILTAIIGYGNLLQMKIKEDDPLRAYINQILLSSEKAANLTHGLLAFSRKQIINPKPVNLNDIVKNVEKLLLRLIGEDIELQTILIDEDVIIMADSGQIEQVLMNLATNARDAMPEGGTLTISTEIVELDREYIRTSGYGKPGKYALISVTDTGAGIDDKTREKIFEPFFTTKEVGKGTGLGLSMVYGIIKQHNGYINVYSAHGKGTTFVIYLPLIKAEVKELKPTEPAPTIGGTETILLAEDEADVRTFTKHMLEEFGYTVIEAEDGEDAINRFMENKDKIELLLLDVIMPKKNGREVYEDIRKIKPDVKALFISGYTANVIHKKGILAEGLNFVLKPISPQELLKRIREILET